jgi:hypothetical protein
MHCARAAMGGSITLDTALGRGARFTVSVPVQRVCPAEDVPAAGGGGSTPDAPPTQHSADVADAAAAPATPTRLATPTGLAVDAPAATPAPPLGAVAAAAAAPDGRRRRILLVDDHLLNLCWRCRRTLRL